MTDKLNILFLAVQPFCIRDYKRFCLEEFISMGHNVNIIDVSKLFPLSFSASEKIMEDIVTYADSWEQVYSYAKQIEKPGVIYLSLMFREPKFFKFLHWCQKSNFYIIDTRLGTPPEFVFFSENRYKYYFYLFKKSPDLFVKIVKHKFRMTNLVNLHKVQNDIILASGSLSVYKQNRQGSSPNSVIWAHSFDYEAWLKCNNSKDKTQDSPYAIFLDHGACSHSDYQARGITSVASPEIYYNQMNKVFEKIENHYGIPVVIASHPKSIYDEFNNPFNDRKLYKYRTAQLVRDSKFVIGQSLTTTSFPILFNKPLVFITTKELMSSRYYLDVRGLQYFINNHIIDADKFIKQKINGCIKKIDSSIIKKYTKIMLKNNNSNEGSLAEIISTGLLKYIYS